MGAGINEATNQTTLLTLLKAYMRGLATVLTQVVCRAASGNCWIHPDAPRSYNRGYRLFMVGKTMAIKSPEVDRI